MEGEEKEEGEGKGLVAAKRRTKKRLRRSLIYIAKWSILHDFIATASIGASRVSPRGVCQGAGLTFSASLAFYFTPEARLYPPPKRVYRKLARAVSFIMDKDDEAELKARPLVWGERPSDAVTAFASLYSYFSPVNLLPGEEHLQGRTPYSAGEVNRHARAFLAGEEAKTKQFQAMPLREKVSLVKAHLYKAARLSTKPLMWDERPSDAVEAFARFYSVLLCGPRGHNLISMRLINNNASSPSEGGVSSPPLLTSEERSPTLEMFFAREEVDEREARLLIYLYHLRYPFPFDLNGIKVVAIGTVPLHHFLPPVRISAKKRRTRGKGTLGGIVRSGDGLCYGITAHHVVFPPDKAHFTFEPEVSGGDEAATSQDKMSMEEGEGEMEGSEEEYSSEEEGEGVEGEGEHDDDNDNSDDEGEPGLNVDIECDLVEVRAHYSAPEDDDDPFPFTKLEIPERSLESRFLGYGVSLPPFRRRDLAVVELDTRIAFTVGALHQPVGRFTLFPSIDRMTGLEKREVVKYGCRTSHTQGTIESVDTFAGVAIVLARGWPHLPFARQGDSGSLCITTEGELVGVVSAVCVSDGRVIVRLLAQEDLEVLD